MNKEIKDRETDLFNYLQQLSKDDIIGITLREFNESRYLREVKIGELLQENQQLKEELRIKQDDFKCANEEIKQLKGKLKLAEHNKEQSELQCRRYRNKRKTLNHRIKRREQQRDRYKSVLDEIREYIDRKRKNFIFSYGVGNEFIREYDDLLEILDKVKE